RSLTHVDRDPFRPRLERAEATDLTGTQRSVDQGVRVSHALAGGYGSAGGDDGTRFVDRVPRENRLGIHAGRFSTGAAARPSTAFATPSPSAASGIGATGLTSRPSHCAGAT